MLAEAPGGMVRGYDQCFLDFAAAFFLGAGFTAGGAFFAVAFDLVVFAGGAFFVAAGFFAFTSRFA